MSDEETESPSPPDGTAVETLRSARDEARTTLNHQLSALDDIDDRAMRTVRIALVVVGLLISATTLDGVRRFVNAVTVSGAVALVVCILTGLSTYSATDPEAGTDPDYLVETLDAPFSEKEWLSTLVAGYAEWIEDARALNETNAQLLVLAQLSLGTRNRPARRRYRARGDGCGLGYRRGCVTLSAKANEQDTWSSHPRPAANWREPASTRVQPGSPD